MPGIYSIYKKNNFPFYDERTFFDISYIYKRFKLALNDKNYKHQVFFWEEGKVYRAYMLKKEIKIEESMYIHFKKRKTMCLNFDNIEEIKSFYITNTGFYNKLIKKLNIEDIKKHNKYKGELYEFVELLIFTLKNNMKKIDRKIKEKIKHGKAAD